MAIITLKNNSLSNISSLPNGIVTASALASGVGGKVLQVVAQETGSQTSLTSLGDINGLSASITISAGSKIYIVGECGFYSSSANWSNWGGCGELNITDNSNNIKAYSEHVGNRFPQDAEVSAHICISTLISGLSAGTYTYKLRGGSTGGQTIVWHRSGHHGGIFLYEIGA